MKDTFSACASMLEHTDGCLPKNWKVGEKGDCPRSGELKCYAVRLVKGKVVAILQTARIYSSEVGPAPTLKGYGPNDD